MIDEIGLNQIDPVKIKDGITTVFHREIENLNVIKIYFTKWKITITESYSHHCFVVIKNNLPSKYQYAKKLFSNELQQYLFNSTNTLYSVQVYEEDRFDCMVDKRRINVSSECVGINLFETQGQQQSNETERLKKELHTDAIAELTELLCTNTDTQQRLLEQAIQAKKYNLVNYIISQQTVISNELFVELLKNKAGLAIIKQIYDKMNEGYYLDIVAEYGDLDVFKFFYFDKKQKTSKRTMNIAAKYGHSDIVKFLYNVEKGTPEDAIVIAQYYNREYIVSWLDSKGYSL